VTLGEKAGWKATRPDAPLSCAHVAGLLESWRGANPVTDVRQLDGGLMNRNYRVQLGSDVIVLRFFDRDRRAGAKEASILRQLHGVLAVPSVLHFDPAPPDDGPPFAVLELIDGITLRQLKASGSSTAIADAAHDAGLQLARLASARLTDPAILDVELPLDPAVLHGSHVNASLIDHYLRSALVHQRLEQRDVDRVSRWAWMRDDRLSSAPAISAIAHGDFNSANVLVREVAGHWKVAAILDWEFAFRGNIFHDVGNFLRYERPDRSRFEPAFSAGLADGGVTLPADWRELSRLADLVALCELLTRPDVPHSVVIEVCDLVRTTIATCDLP
jgi:aminoglycoside phosphotransferase (APT) family kinase protein